MPQRVTINAVAYEEGGAWIAQGIEYDIVAFANDVLDLPDAFACAVAENIYITEQLGREPLKGIKPAPTRFVELFERSGRVDMRPTKQGANADVSVRVAA